MCDDKTLPGRRVLRAWLLALTREALPEGASELNAERVTVQRAPRGRGIYTSNLALELAGKLRRPPREVAAQLVKAIRSGGGWAGAVEEVNGFLNFDMNDQALGTQLEAALQHKERYGAGQKMAGQRINVEFVSADPTGPLHFESGRHAALGEALCRLLELQGADITREFYLNDVETSSTMQLLGESVAGYYLAAFGREGEWPEGALRDAFVRGVAQEVSEAEGNRYLLVPEEERRAAFAHRARDAAVAAQKKTLRAFGVVFDVWTSENALRREGRVQFAVEQLKESGHVYEREGALWLRTTGFGDESDRPLVRANGQVTYLAADIAYHVFKLERGFERLLNLWTAGHAPYVQRTRAALQAAGYSPDALEVKLAEGACLTSDGTLLEGAAGDLTLDEALLELDRDTLWFSLLLPEWDAVAAIDVEVARRDDEGNPAYAALLLPARLGTLLRQAEAAGGSAADAIQTFAGDEARALAQLVALWPDEAETAASERRPQRVAQFVLEMAGAVRRLLAAGQAAYNAPLLRAAQITATNALRAVGIEARTQF